MEGWEQVARSIACSRFGAANLAGGRGVEGAEAEGRGAGKERE